MWFYFLSNDGGIGFVCFGFKILFSIFRIWLVKSFRFFTNCVIFLLKSKLIKYTTYSIRNIDNFRRVWTNGFQSDEGRYSFCDWIDIKTNRCSFFSAVDWLDRIKCVGWSAQGKLLSHITIIFDFKQYNAILILIKFRCWVCFIEWHWNTWTRCLLPPHIARQPKLWLKSDLNWSTPSRMWSN